MADKSASYTGIHATAVERPTMNHATPPSPTPAGRTRRRVIIAVIALAAVGASALAAARMGGADLLPGMHGRHGHHAPRDPAALAAQVDQAVGRLLPDGTPEQKAKLAAIAKSALADLAPVRERLQAARTRAQELLMAPVVDRAALEQLRAAQIVELDAASKRMLGAVEDAADLLTPDQRQRFHAMMRKRVH
jgi:protein CpxP